MSFSLLNGKTKSTIDINDRGLLYGDGLFETIRVYQRDLRLWGQHMQRLEQGCVCLGLPMPDIKLLESEAKSVMNADNGVIKIIVTRGAAERGFKPPNSINSSRIVIWQDAPEYDPAFAREGVRLRICDTRLAIQPALAGLKHLNCLQQVMARAEWQDDSIQEGLMLDTKDNVIEGSMSNLFVVKNSKLYTPDLSQCGVRGVVRDSVIQSLKKLNLSFAIENIKVAQVKQADELFLCNSLIGIWPVRQLEDKNFTVGSITRKIMEHLVY